MQTRLLIRTLLAGFAAGAGGAATYLLLGGSYFITIPHWAKIAFAPGFLAGNWTYDVTHAETSAKVVGVFAVGFAYALLALFVRWIGMCALQFGRADAWRRAKAQERNLSRSAVKSRLDG